jgi:hypothetical protein
MIMEALGNKSKATSSNYQNKAEYEFRYKVVDLDSLIPSHTDLFNPNPAYPKELQPRLRDRASSKVQVDMIANQLNPKGLLNDTGHIDTGIMIVGDDDVVESGNGRVLALRKARESYPDKYNDYVSQLYEYADKYGIEVSGIDAIPYPVLVRERVTPVDRVAFTADANVSATMSMSSHEQAMQDANRISDELLSELEVGDEQSIDQALRSTSNKHIVMSFAQKVPATERASISDDKGNLSIAGLTRLKSALFAKTYKGKAGNKLSQVFSESTEPVIKTIENAMFQSLPAMAKAQGLIHAGYREKDIQVSNDLAVAIEKYATLKQTGLSVANYMKQSKMFGEDMTELQLQILEHLDTIGRSSKLTREFIKSLAERIEKAPMKGQTSMLGDEAKINKEVIINESINSQRKEKGLNPLPLPAFTAASEGLEEPDKRGDKVATGVERVASGELGQAGGVSQRPTISALPFKPRVLQLGNFFATQRSSAYKAVRKGKPTHSIRTTIHYGTPRIVNK